MRLKISKEKLLESFKSYLSIAISIASIFAFYFIFRWAGIKGLIMFVAGLTVMAYLLLSKNSMVMALVEWTDSDAYINIMRGDDDNEEKEK